MPQAKTDSRERLINAAIKLAYQHGFGKSSLAHIAKEAEVPLGNIYYYFKTKDELGEAIVERRLAQMQARRMEWDEITSPKERLCFCINQVSESRDLLASGGCAVGTFCSELQKTDNALAKKASAIFVQHLEWLETQFRLMGKTKDAHSLSLHLLSALQGVAFLAHSLRSPEFVTLETDRLKEWVRSL